jgi:hypothetical protein
MWYFILGVVVGGIGMWLYVMWEASRPYYITCPRCGMKFEEDV